MLGLTGAIGAFMELLAEAALETGLGLAAQAALGVGAAAGVYVVVKRARKKRAAPVEGDPPAQP